MRILYIFPHPDDESFGPAPAISSQINQGLEVYLLTLTKGEATKQRYRLGVTKKEMGDIRYEEMKCVEKVLGLKGMSVLDLPDGQLKEIDPIDIERVVIDHIKKIKPDVLVTYAVHGISGFHDHLVTHAVVKRAFCELKRNRSEYPKRLAFFTRMGEVDVKGKFRLEASSENEIDYIEQCSDRDMKAFNLALDCYKTYQQVIKESNVREVVTNEVPFEFFMENHDSKNKYKSIVDGI